MLRHTIGALAALAASASTSHASCVVTPFEVLDHSRTAGVPYASPADSGGTPARIRMLVYSNDSTRSVRPRYADLINAVVPGVNATENLVSRKRAVGIARCGSISGVSIGALIGGWGPNELYPAGADKSRPEMWKRVQ